MLKGRLCGEEIGAIKEIKVKKGIHPEYYETTITCGCGNSIKTKSTSKNLKVEICSQCHPFYSGKQKLIDTAGRVERFRQKYNLVEKSAGTAKSNKAKKPEAKAKTAVASVTEESIPVSKQ